VSVIFALDATSDSGSMALLRDGQILEEVEMESPDGFAHVLFNELERLLARHGLSIEQVDLFAAASGPGSFTGVRVGLTAVKGLAEATGKKAAAVSNLQAIASFGSKPVRAAVIDARRGEIYGGVYDASLNLLADEVVMPLDQWLGHLPVGEVEVIAAGSIAITGKVTRAPKALAGAIAKIAAAKPQLARDPAEIDANYVRRSDAELLWRDRAH
jgi:tRNA threonylcarbamoyladenosine biosynthesis protein TsaB